MPPRPPAPRPTHFLCLPLTTPTSRPHLQTSLSVFRHGATPPTPSNPSGIPPSAIRPVGTLHLTLGVMTLPTPADVSAAVDMLRGVERRPARVTLRGLESMHDPARTSVLYAAPVDGDGELYAWCGRVRERFVDAGLMVREARPLLLHATILNTVYVRGQGRGVAGRGGRGRGRGGDSRLTVDARDLITRYEDFEWVRDVRVESLAVCRMGARDVGGGDEEYVVEGELLLP